MRNKVDYKKLFVCATAMLCMCMNSALAAGGLEASTIGVGIKNMLNDLGNFLLLLSPVIGGVTATIFIIRRGMADEQDGKMWFRRSVIAVVCAIGGMLVATIIKVVGSYFGV